MLVKYAQRTEIHKVMPRHLTHQEVMEVGLAALDVFSLPLQIPQQIPFVRITVPNGELAAEAAEAEQVKRIVAPMAGIKHVALKHVGTLRDQMQVVVQRLVPQEVTREVVLEVHWNLEELPHV